MKLAMKLTREAIIAEAVALLREGGLAQVSLRRIAARLSVQAPSLAHHVGNKDTLIALISESIFRSTLSSVPPCETWQDWLKEFGRAFWREQNNTRDSARLIAISPPRAESMSNIVNDISAAVRRVGLDPEVGMRMQSSVQALVTGWVIYNQSAASGSIARIHSIEESFEDSLDALIAGWAIKLASPPRQHPEKAAANA
ncbi:MAG: TetR/AcrR family transcriptional regulator, tetracycline repressor protein [Sphingomonas bacterium]|jgi:TetR/AcrR family tetracycline transcriptional repressor|nr:TetR/AcrR family transcriptional regulator, tetracycline repressor protein [Sphingomonas bacterium]